MLSGNFAFFLLNRIFLLKNNKNSDIIKCRKKTVNNSKFYIREM